MKENLIIVGKNSYIGGYLTKYNTTNRDNVLSLSSEDCNFLEASEVDNLFASLGRDRSYTLVFLATINRLVNNSFDSYIQNLTIAKNLLKACKIANIQSIIYFSSVDVYGSKPSPPITEQSKIDPDTWYGLAKYSCEWMLMSSGEVKCPVTILRIPGIYGCAPNDRSVIKKIVSVIKNEKRVVIKGRGQQLRDYVYIEDICRLIQLLIPLKFHGILNVATGHSYTIIDIVNLVGTLWSMEFETIYEAADAARDFDLVFDTSYLASLLPNFRFTDLEVGMRSYFQPYNQVAGGELR